MSYPADEERDRCQHKHICPQQAIAGIEAQTIRKLIRSCYKAPLRREKIVFVSNYQSGKGAIAELLRPEERAPERQRQRATLVVHEVQRGETLLSIARRYGQEDRMLMGLSLQTHLRVGQKLKLLLQSLRGTLR